jgi:hypothetical protein
VTIGRLILIFVALALPVGWAQGAYVGAVVGTPLRAEFTAPTDTFELGGQLGFDAVGGFGARVAVEGNPFNTGLKLGSATAIFRFYLPLSYNSLYTGVGADAFFGVQPGSLNDLRGASPIAHALLGFEGRLIGGFGLFAEVLPSYIVGGSPTERTSYYLRGRSGINFYF